MIATTGEGDTYFTTRFGVGTKWSSLSSGDKTSLLQTAENDLTAAYGTLTSSDSIKKCIFEQSYARLIDPDIDSRMVLQRQGVRQAGIIKESYTGGGAGVFVCAYCQNVLGNPEGVALGAASPVLNDSDAEEPRYTYYSD